MMIAEMGPTNPEAGVIVASPAMAPDAAPRAIGLPLHAHSAIIHERAMRKYTAS